MNLDFVDADPFGFDDDHEFMMGHNRAMWRDAMRRTGLDPTGGFKRAAHIMPSGDGIPWTTLISTSGMLSKLEESNEVSTFGRLKYQNPLTSGLDQPSI